MFSQRLARRCPALHPPSFSNKGEWTSRILQNLCHDKAWGGEKKRKTKTQNSDSHSSLSYLHWDLSKGKPLHYKEIQFKQCFVTKQGQSYWDSNHPHKLHAKQAYLERNSGLFKHCPHLAKSVVHLRKSFGSNKGELVSRTCSKTASWHTRATERLNVFGVPWWAAQENSCDSMSTKRKLQTLIPEQNTA